ncbi:hypothetical protein [Ornithinimicrobium kibberense]|uniref:hypothetical protein n=1 Tax=Ornithinimicrobium kibberense TaxID=282060 RepID=UPI00360D625D
MGAADDRRTGSAATTHGGESNNRPAPSREPLRTRGSAPPRACRRGAGPVVRRPAGRCGGVAQEATINPEVALRARSRRWLTSLQLTTFHQAET